MQPADDETVVCMDEAEGPRRVEWSGWGIIFCRGSRVIAKLHFPVGPAGPKDETLGLPEHEAYGAVCRAWVARGELPMRACTGEAHHASTRERA